MIGHAQGNISHKTGRADGSHLIQSKENSMEYNSGYKTYSNVKDINKLADLTQDEANQLAIGPQEAFFDKLDAVNAELNCYNIEPIDVTNKWNWKPGSYDKIKQYMTIKLQLNKKAMSIDKIMTRAQDRMNYIGYIQRQASTLEREKYNLKRMGVSRDVDIDEFKEECVVFVDDLINECKKAFELTQEKVLIVPYISLDDGRNARIFYDITLKDMNLSVYDNSVLLQEIPLQPIHIIHSTSLRHTINSKNYTSYRINGKYKAVGPRLSHPYISSSYRNHQSGYGTVCLDKFNDEVIKSINNHNMIALAMSLMQWAQYYNIKSANPYNQPYMSHIGMPGSFSKEYKATQSLGSATKKCSQSLRQFSITLGNEYLEEDNFISKICDNIDCSIKEYCTAHAQISTRKVNLNSEWWCQVEALVNLVVEWLFELDTLSTIQSKVKYIIGDSVSYDAETSKDDYKQKVTDRLFYYYSNFKHQEFCTYTYKFLEVKMNFIEPEKPADTNECNKSEEEMKAMMQLWVNSQT